jgi:hypothetical protein
MTPLPPNPPKDVTVTPWGTPHGSLWTIAEEIFEDGTKWRDIYAANRDAIGVDPGKLRIGMRIRLPSTEVYPAYLRSVAGVFESEAHDVDAALGAAMRKLDAAGNFWGNDSLGAKFNNGADGRYGYAVTHGRVADATSAFAGFFRNVARGLHTVADRRDTVEWANAATALSGLLALLEKDS